MIFGAGGTRVRGRGSSSIWAGGAGAWEGATWSTRSAASMNEVAAEEYWHTLAPEEGLPSTSSRPPSVLLEDGQRPAPAGEFAGDRGVGHHGAFLAGVEVLPAGVQPAVGGLSAGPRRRARLIPAPPQPHSGAVGGAVVPGRFDQQPPGVAVAGLGDPPWERVAPEEDSVGTNPR